MRFFTLALLFLFSQHSFSQLDIEWQLNLGGSELDVLTDLITTSDGGYLVSGYTNSSDIDETNHKGQNDAILIKLSSDGDIIWQKTYGGSKADVASSVVEVSDGYIFTGTTNSSDGDIPSNNGLNDIFVIKVDTAGNIVWVKILGNSDSDTASDIIVTRDGGIAIVGARITIVEVTWLLDPIIKGDVLMMKMSQEGNLEWERLYGGSEDEQGKVIRELATGYVIGGWTESSDEDVSNLRSERDYWVINITPTGTMLWEWTFGGGPGKNTLSDIINLGDGYIIYGDHGGDDCWVIRAANDGSVLWQKSIGGLGRETAYTLSALDDGSFLGTGTTSTDALSNDNLFFKLSADGEILWTETFGGSAYDDVRIVQALEDGSYLLGGISNSDDGFIDNPQGDYDMWILKLNALPVSSTLPDPNASRLKLYPNPASDILNVELEEIVHDLQYSINNILGVEIQDGILNGLSSKIDVSKFVSGTYLFRVESDSKEVSIPFVKK